MSSARRLGGGSGVDGASGPELLENGFEPNGLLKEEQAASITAAVERTAAVSKWRMRSIGVSSQPRNSSRRMRHRFAAGRGGPIIVSNVKILRNKADLRFSLRGLCGERKGNRPPGCPRNPILPYTPIPLSAVMTPRRA